MFSKKKLLFFGLLLPVIVLAQQAAPVIIGFSPKLIVKGQLVRISGQNLSQNVSFVNVLNQSAVSAVGLVEENSTVLIVVVPPTLQPGNYMITVSGPGGSTNTGLDTLEVKDTSFTPSNYSVPAVPTLLGVSTFGDLIGVIFDYSFQILGVIIFITFVWAGFMWLTAGGNPGTIGKARSKMTSAILGAILLLSSYLILNTINPDLVNVGFTLKGINIKSSGGGVISANSQVAAQNLKNTIGIGNFSTNATCGNNFHARQNIEDIAAGRLPNVCNSNCPANSTIADCPVGGQSGNVNVNPAIPDGLVRLWQERGLRFIVTSLTTGKHAPSSAHYGGNAVDIVPNNRTQSVWLEARNALNSYGGDAMCEISGNRIQNCDNFSSGAHIHWRR